VILAALILTVTDPALAALADADRRVAAAAFRLQTANVARCADAVSLPGFSLQSLSQYNSSARATAAREFGLGAAPSVLAVAPGSDAARIGLQTGDALTAIGLKPVPQAVKSGYDQVAETEDALAAALAEGPVSLTVKRGDQQLSLVLSGDRGCASRVQFVPGRVLDAGADGQYVRIHGGMLAFVADDTELAIVIAHELSHNILKHRVRLDAAGVGRGLFAGIGRGGAALRASEVEADVLAVRLLATAGYDVTRIVAFWQRLRARMGGLTGPSHPGWRTRIAAVATAVSELSPAATKTP